MGLQCHKSDKIWVRFAIISNGLKILVKYSSWTPEYCTHKPIYKGSVFAIQDLYTVALILF